MKERVALFGLGLIGLIGVFYVVGGITGVVLVAGVIVGAAIILWPRVGLGLLLLGAIPFQTLWSGPYIGLPVSVTQIIGLLTFAGWFVWAARRRFAITFTPPMIPLAVFAGVLVLSALVVPDSNRSLMGLFKFSEVFLLYFLIVDLTPERRTLIATCAILSVVVTVSSMIGLLEYVLPQLALVPDDPTMFHQGISGAVVDLDSVESGAIKRVTGGLNDPSWFSYTVAATLPLSLFWWRNVLSMRARVVVLGMTAIQLTGLILSITRGGFFGALVAAAYLVVKRRLPLVPTLAVTAGAIMILAVWTPQTWVDRMFSLRYFEEGSTPIRQEWLEIGWHMFTEKWLLGYGYGRFGPEYLDRQPWSEVWRLTEEVSDEDRIRVHNMYLEIAIEYGVLGVLTFLAFVFVTIKQTVLVERYATRGDRDLSVCLRAGIIAFLTCGIVGHAELLKVIWILAGLSAALRQVVFAKEPAAGVPRRPVVRVGEARAT